VSADERLGSVGTCGIVYGPAADERGEIRRGPLAVELVTPDASRFENAQAGSALARRSRRTALVDPPEPCSYLHTVKWYSAPSCS